MDSARRWSGYVCPDCRFVFRVPKDHDGRGVVCPGCRRLLRIPGPGVRLQPLVVPLKGGAPEALVEDFSGQKGTKQRRKRKGPHAEKHEWDSGSTKKHGSGRREKRQMFWMTVGGATLFLLIVAGVVMTMLGGKEPDPIRPAGETVTSPAVGGSETNPPPVPKRSDAAILAEAEPLVRSFLDATRIEDMLPLVRNPEVAEARMRRQYPGGVIEAFGMAAFDTTSELSRHGSILAVGIRTRSYENRSVAFFDTPEGIRIDWESWVGWSEMSWEEFFSAKPETAKVFRVQLSSVDYFNFEFSDDIKWKSYRLESPDGEHAVFGYVERGSVLDSRLHPSPDVKQVALTLALKFPEDTTAGNQVLIENVIAEGWVLERDETP
jgi:hypothetical protein